MITYKIGDKVKSFSRYGNYGKIGVITAYSEQNQLFEVTFKDKSKMDLSKYELDLVKKD